MIMVKIKWLLSLKIKKPEEPRLFISEQLATLIILFLKIRRRENWDDYTSAGSLSKHILWGDTTSIEKNIKAFKKKFKL